MVNVGAQRLMALLNASNELIQYISPEGKILFVNDKWKQTLGFSDKEIESLLLFDIIAEESQADCADKFKTVMQGIPLHNFKAVFKTQNGQKVYLEGNSIPEIIDGVVVGTQSFLQDVTLVKLANDRLVSMAKFPEANPSPVLQFSKSGTLLYNNSASANIVNDIVSDFKLNYLTDGIETKQIEINDSIYILRYFPLEDDELVNVYASDITKQVLAEREANAQKEYIEELLNNIPADIALFNIKHQYLYVNKTGIKNDDLRRWIINKDDFDYYELKGIDNTQAKERRALFDMAIEKVGDVDFVDDIIKNGVEHHILRRYHPVLDNTKQVKYVIGYGVDVTEQIAFKNRLVSTHNMLLDNQVFLKRVLHHFVHNVRHPLLNMEGLLENFNTHDYNDPFNKTIIPLLLNSYNELNTNFGNLTKQIDNSFKLFATELIDIDVTDFCNKLIEPTKTKYGKQLHFKIDSTGGNTICFYEFMFERLFSDLIKFSSKYTADTGLFLDINLPGKNAMLITIPDVEISADTLQAIQNNLLEKSLLELNGDEISNIACIVNFTGGLFDMKYSNKHLTISLNLLSITNIIPAGYYESDKQGNVS
jgi:PAS domain S-box-containing protein